MQQSPPSVFVSYSHRDLEWKTRIVDYLKVLELDGHFDVWDDTRIEAGGDWLADIERALSAARVALLLVSVNSLTSSFIRKTEIPDLLRRRMSEGLRLIPVILRHCPWTEIPWLSSIRAFPFDGKPLAALPDHAVDEQLTRLATEVKEGLSADLPLPLTPMSTPTQDGGAPTARGATASVSTRSLAGGDSLVLLCDFDRAYRWFEWATPGGTQPYELVGPMRDAVRAIAPRLRVHSRAEIVGTIADCAELTDAYLITLDGRAFFRKSREFDLTRIAYTPETIVSGPYYRALRDSVWAVDTRALQLAAHYRKHGEGRKIVLCDDGIGTGESLRQVVQQLTKHIKPHAVVVLLNPNAIASVEGVPVVSLLDCPSGSSWINERDLYWGLPRSGVTMQAPQHLLQGPGVPYSFATELLASRVGLATSVAAKLRATILEINKTFWLRLEEHYDKALLLHDSERMEGLTSRLGLPNSRIVDLIDQVSLPSFVPPFQV